MAVVTPSIVRQEILWLRVFLLFFLTAVKAQSNGTATANGSQSGPYGLYSNFDPSMAIVIAVLVAIFFFVGFFSIFVRHCSEYAPGTNNFVLNVNRSGTRGLDPAVIETFPVFVYSSVKEIKIGRGTLECAICLSEFEDDETLRLLPKCDHVFHPECIDAWLVSHVTCPVCRANLTVQPHESPITPPEQSPAVPIQDNAAPEPRERETHNEVTIAVEEEAGQKVITNRPPRTGVSGKFPRSHSTGHSLVQQGESIDRYTLRLPSEARRQLMTNAKLKRALSFNVVLGSEGSCKKGYRSSGEGSSRGKQSGWSDRWALLMNSSFVSRGSSMTKSPKDENDAGDSVNGRTLLASVKMPLYCLGTKVDEKEQPQPLPPV